MTTQYWLVKSEPASYAWDDLLRDGHTAWTGVRNYAARNHLRGMRAGDQVLFYHSGEAKSVIGLGGIIRPAFPDPTAPAGEDWSAVELHALRTLPSPVTLTQIRAQPALAGIALLRQGRLSVQPLAAKEFALILKLGGA